MQKPIVKIKNVEIIGRNDHFILAGNVQDHPRFEKDEKVFTSRILRIETKNTIYELED